MDSLYQTIIILEELLAEIKEPEVEELIKKKIDTLKKEEIIRLEAESNMLKFKGEMANFDVKMINHHSNGSFTMKAGDRRDRDECERTEKKLEELGVGD